MVYAELHRVMQMPQLYPMRLNIWTTPNGLFHGEVYGSKGLYFFSHNKQFINELLEELDDKASVFLDNHIKVETSE